MQVPKQCVKQARLQSDARLALFSSFPPSFREKLGGGGECPSYSDFIGHLLSNSKASPGLCHQNFSVLTLLSKARSSPAPLRYMFPSARQLSLNPISLQVEWNSSAASLGWFFTDSR